MAKGPVSSGLLPAKPGRPVWKRYWTTPADTRENCLIFLCKTCLVRTPLVTVKVKVRFVSLIVLLATVLAVGCVPDEAAYPTLAGETVRFSEYRGKVVFINYWAEWCAPCRVEIPELNRFAREYAERAVVFSVNFDGVGGDTLRQQVDAMGIAFQTLLRDPRHDLGAAPAKGLPETLIVDSQGQLADVLLGPQTLETLKAQLP
ncbi:MAG TPA: peroxiredoxin [Porticoccaceae bacterium]|nr:peroxiredoxin [Porticoccaceae bacterium]